ncbi:7-carboxy-7-deazaguanine synthase ['Osedax' symbiont bacterium Rs2_46_30_T18]|nr:7-carboxy-7-deazaguanine synthase ['Osedax' symbiont bacterium Rs2_46_30_T18]
MYKVKEMFYTLQGEGAQAGRPAVFCRFTGCNLWSGRERDRAKSVCDFCDTDFIGTDGQNGAKFSTALELADKIASFWPTPQLGRSVEGVPYVVFTGGEPALQLDEALTSALKQRNFEIAIETNGTKQLPAGIDWICVSPKADAEVIIECGQELKLVYPQSLAMPQRFEQLNFEHFYLQPMAQDNANHTKATIEYCMAHPRWKLSLQTHKITGID